MSDFVKGARKAPVEPHAGSREPRLPVQGRSQERMARVMAAAEKLLIEAGPEAASIPDIATAADVPRASIYQYYPDKYALFAQMAEAHMQELGSHISAAQPKNGAVEWRKAARTMIGATAAYYNAHPAAGILLLTGPFGRKDREAHTLKDAALARQFRLLIGADKKSARLPTKPDVVAIAVEVAFAVLKYGYARDGSITKSTCDEAVRAAVNYLSEWT